MQMIHHRNRIIIGVVTISVLICIGISSGVCGASEPSPQYANIAPLPGGGVAINSAGKADGMGAMQINIPVAYNPISGFMNLSVYKGDHIGESRDQQWGNGTGLIGMSFGNSPSLYISGMQCSRVRNESKALNVQMNIVKESTDSPAISIGTQDILLKEKNNRSLYIASTKKIYAGNSTLYTTLGYGGGRFLDKIFGGISVPVGNCLNFATEWDGYQINTGVGWRPNGRYGHVTLLLGYNGKAGWLAGMGTAFSIR